MPKVLIDGNLVDVPADALYADDGTTPFGTPTPPPGQTFTAADIERVRQEEKDKLYGQLERTTSELTALREQVGTLTAEQEERKKALEAEEARLAEEKKRQEEAELDARTLIERKTQEWQQTLEQEKQTWESKFAEEQAARQQAEALAAKEREFSTLSQYTAEQLAANKDKIAPELVRYVAGNSKEEIDAAIAQAVETTDQIAQQFQQAFQQNPGVQQVQQPQVQFNEQGQLVVPQPAQPGQQVVTTPQPPATPGTRVTGPGQDPNQTYQRLSADDIANMDMTQYAKLRGSLGIGGQSNNRGMYG